MKMILRKLAVLFMIAGMTMMYPANGFSKSPVVSTPPKNNFNIMMNYELGMHCTGFEFSYCCVLPPYNSILAQVVKTERTSAKPRLLQADPNVGLDFLGRPTVVRDLALGSNGQFQKYVLRYWHDAQPRNDGRGKAQTSTLISNVEGNSLLMWNTRLDAAATDSNNKLVYGPYEGQSNVVQGNGVYTDPEDNYANAWVNHLYIYAADPGFAPLDGTGANNSLDANKVRLGSRNLNSNGPYGHFSTVTPPNFGPAFNTMGPGNPLAGAMGPGFGYNVLTFSGNNGTVVYTQMKVLENLPVMLTSPRLWEALGLPLTPFEDDLNFFADPGLVTEATIRPFVQMKAQLHNFDAAQPGGIGAAVLQDGNPIIGLGTAPIDIPNCERCHSLGDGASANSPQNGRPAVAAKVQEEMDFWNTYYNIDTNAGDSDWYSRLKAAAISILAIHDEKHGTSFTAHYPLAVAPPDMPQLLRLGHESVMCQKCHADNVIAVVKSALIGDGSTGELIPPLTEAIHNNHSGVAFSDSKGRNGSCQGCHPSHRSDGKVEEPDAYFPITKLGLNAFASGDNRDGVGGCYANRDVHANRNRAANLATKPHLNGIGKWLVKNVAKDSGTDKGIWCTNCHTQLSQELWKAENNADIVHSTPGAGNVREPRRDASLKNIASAIGVTLKQAIAWLDPKTDADTFAVWNDPEATDYPDASVATIEASLTGACSPAAPNALFLAKYGAYACYSTDADGDPSVRPLGFCTTPDCVAADQLVLDAEGNGSIAFPAQFADATDGRDHWLSPGEPHCADCHAAPFTEQSGNINAFPPFNYPRKASLFRYSRGHQDITCQGCHESTHGLYPVTSDIDTTTYAQAAGMNTDGSHGPLKCGACHAVNAKGVPSMVKNIKYKGKKIANNFDAAVSWMHSFTDEADPTTGLCLNCHKDNSSKVACNNSEWTMHAMDGRVSREQMDKAEASKLGAICGSTNPLTTVCQSCHATHTASVSCSNSTWLKHLPEGRVSESVWENVSTLRTGGTCGY